MAAAKAVTPAALLLRWALNRGVAVIPGATSAQHIRENLHLPPVAMSSDELRRIGSTSTRPRSFTSWTNLPSEQADKRKGRGKKRRKGRS